MAQLNRSLNLRDLILQNIAAIVGFSTLSLSAQFGWSSITLNLVVLLFFVMPAILMILDLSLRMPGEGGFYLWTKSAFGEFHGFIAAWSYWLSNLVWFPSVILSVLTVGSFLFSDHQSPETSSLSLGIGLVFLWLIVGINILGLQKAKWIQNIGGLSTGMTILLLTIFGIIYWWEAETIRSFAINQLMPETESWELFPFFAAITFSWAGIELTPVLAGEVKHPQKTIPKALIIGSFCIAAIYIMGTMGLLITLPTGSIDEILGIPQAFGAISAQLQMPWLSTVGTLLVLFSFIGLFAVWMTGNARVPFVIGLDHFLPPGLGAIHAKFHTPYVSLIVQGIIISILLIGALAGSTIKEAFLVLVDMSIILFFIPFIYMFLTFLRFQKNSKDTHGMIWLKKYKTVGLFAASLGLLITIFTIMMAMLPSQSIENPTFYYVKVIGGSGLLLALGTAFFIKNKPRAHQ